MKKFINYIRKFLILFVLIAYSFPIFIFPVVSFLSIMKANETVNAQEITKKVYTPLVDDINKDTVEKFADNVFNEQLKKFNVPGAVFAVVKDNKIIFKKGYGYSDIDKKTPVDPKSTIFRAASISKLFTTTAVMQLKEKGKLNLNTDVNNYLKDFKIEDNYSKPVTLENLLTHTAGFDEKIIGESNTESYLNEKSLKDNLISRRRSLIREPGEEPQYSNYGMALAGYIVESVSNTPFEKYMEDNIFKPLHMDNSSFIFDKKTLDNLSQGYDYKNGTYKKVPIYGQVFSPAGGLKTTADDMCKFMVAQLNNGVYDNTSILNKSSIEDMHKKHFPADINIPGMCYGFSENYINGVRVLFHGGDEYGFHSILYLIPESNLGFFISTNGENGVNMRGSIATQFINKYYPQDKSQAQVENNSNFTKSNLKKLEGHYLGNRYPRKEIGKLVMLMYPTVNIKSNSDSLIIEWQGNQEIYKEVSPLIFKNIKTADTIAFKANNQGDISYILQSGSPTAFEKIHWYENPILNRIIFILFPLLFLCLIIIITIFALKKKTAKELSICKYSRWCVLAICLLNLIFLLGITRECINLSHHLAFLAQLPNFFICMLIIPIITSALTFLLLFLTFIYSKLGKSNLNITICNMIASSIFIAFTLFLNFWNLLGFKF